MFLLASARLVFPIPFRAGRVWGALRHLGVFIYIVFFKHAHPNSVTEAALKPHGFLSRCGEREFHISVAYRPREYNITA